MPRRKALKVVVDVHFHAVTCPGVFLPEQQDVFLNVELLGQRKRTKAAPPVFPFLFHEKLRFDKVFSHATDPVQIANALDGESVRIELVQLTYPGGELLATYEDSAREFLFPTPRISPTYPGVDREVLLQRSYSFPGIAPKLEFSSRTIIKEVTSVTSHTSSASSKKKEKRNRKLTENKEESIQHNNYSAFEHPIETSTPHVPTHKRTTPSKTKNKDASRQGRVRARSSSLCHKAVCASSRGYQQSTIASRARSPSPYTKRRMAQLSVNDPFESAVSARPYKSDLEERPEFVVRKAAEDSMSHPAPPLPPLTPPLDRVRTRTPSPKNTRSPLRRKQTPGRPKRLSGVDDYNGKLDSDADTEELIDNALLRQRLRSPISSRPSSARSAPESTPRPLTPKRDLSFSGADVDLDRSDTKSKLTPSSILFRTSLRDRFTANEESPYEKIRDRVRGLLISPRATRIVDDSIAEANEKYWLRRSRSASPRSPRSPKASPRISPSNRIYLGNGEYWDKMADEYSSQPRRAAFESSIDQIYDDIYSRVKHGSA
nr:spermatogenesis-associated protein 6 [Ciona intestinalis]|eukprot:XP_026691521.1 spermatogenesis-associated protein 6 [Ciona intestinalis]